MAAYALSERFPPRPDCHKIGNRDPGAYNLMPCILKPRENKVAFLSGVPRIIKMGRHIYTHSIYDADKPRRITGVTAFQDKCPRFKSGYARPLLEDEEEYTCDCDLRTCVCPEQASEVCQSLVPRKLYKGSVPLSALEGPREHLPKKKNTKGPVFYDARVNESTAFYHGCKWSKRTSGRGERRRESAPGPADYTIEPGPSPQQLCLDEFRFYKRHNTRQLRFMEMVQLRNLLQGGPGPADYDPKLPKCGGAVRKPGTIAERFPDVAPEKRPGPADYSVDGPQRPDFNVKTHARPLRRAPFGVKALRFRQMPDVGPGPAKYSPSVRKCSGSLHCPPPPFFSSAPRFKPDSDACGDTDDEESVCCACPPKPCEEPTSTFKSRTLRFKPLMKRLDYPSPADLVLTRNVSKRNLRLQYLAPFQASEGRFRPWHDWMAVSGGRLTPGPGVYDLKSRPYCVGGGWTMPSAPRFPRARKSGPPPNAYSVNNGIEAVQHTFNKRLRSNLGKKDKFRYSPPGVELRSLRSREACLLAKSIHDLNVEQESAQEILNSPKKKRVKKETAARRRLPGEKLLLRYFLYDHQFVNP